MTEGIAARSGKIPDEEIVGKKVAQCYIMDGIPDGDLVYGTEPGEVKIPAPEAPNMPYIAAHNHASGLSFPTMDIVQFLKNPNMKALLTVGNNGKVYMMVKRPHCNIPELKVRVAVLRQSIGNTNSNADKIQKIKNFYKEAKDYGLTYYA